MIVLIDELEIQHHSFIKLCQDFNILSISIIVFQDNHIECGHFNSISLFMMLFTFINHYIGMQKRYVSVFEPFDESALTACNDWCNHRYMIRMRNL